MKNIIVELKDKLSINQAIKFVLNNFLIQEKSVYSKSELIKAYNSLLNFDIFNDKELTDLVKKGKVKIYINLTSGKIVGVCALEVQSGKILFLSTLEHKNSVAIINSMVEKMVESRVDEKDSRLNIMAFLGQERLLKSCGFTKIYDSVLFYHDLKLVPMKYSYTQFDIEK